MADHDGALVRRAIEAIWNRGEYDVADRLFAADYVNHGGLIPDLVRGPEAVKVGAALFRTAYPRLEVTVDALIAQGGTVALRWTARGAPSAGGSGRSPAGAAGTLTGMTFGRVAGGKVTESWTYWDARGSSPAAPGRGGGAR